MSKIPNLEQISIDSCKLSIPLTLLKTYDSTIIKHIIELDKETGEVLDDFKKFAKRYFYQGFSVYVSIVENKRISRDSYEDSLIILINSKQIGVRYFEGITPLTLPLFYHLMTKEMKIFNCDYDTFLMSSITDIDFKKDYQIGLPNYKELVDGCETMTRPSSSKNKGKTKFSGKDNYGIEWSVRKGNRRAKTQPFVKIYHKGMELMSEKGSLDFFNRYLSAYYDVSNVMRIEVTVQDKKHLQSFKLGLKTFSLSEVISLSQEQMNSIISTCINKHLLPRTKSLAFKTEARMTPTNRIFLNALLGLTLDAKMSYERALNLLLNGIENDSSKSNNKKVLKRLYFDYVNNTDYHVKTEKVESIYSSFGWF